MSENETDLLGALERAEAERDTAVASARALAQDPHDPALGLDRSVCLREVYDWLRGQNLLAGAEELRSAFCDEDQAEVDSPNDWPEPDAAKDEE